MPPSVPIEIFEAGHKSSSPCFNGPPSDLSADGGTVSYKAGKKPLQTLTRLVQQTSCLVRLLLLAILLLLVLVCVLTAVIIKMDAAKASYQPIDTSVPITDLRPGLIPTTDAPTTTKITPTTEEPIPTCTTPGCVRAANNLLNAMNTSADPCSNFFEFACGGWNREHPIPDDMFAYGTFAYAREQLRLQLRVLLESEEGSASKSINMAKTAYKICMNTGQLDVLGSSLLLDAINELGGWPMLTGKDTAADTQNGSTKHDF